MIDSHCHLTDPYYEGGESVINDMPRDGLEAVVTVGYDLKTSEECVRLAEAHDGVYAAVGLHPSEIKDERDVQRILPLLSRKKTVALGEIGLDYHWQDVPRDVQKRVFEAQLEAAYAYGAPVIVHSRDCDGDMLPVLKAWKSKLGGRLVMHCFSSSAEIAKEYVRAGYYVSFAGPVTFRNAKRGDAIRAVPDELLLAETDSPYLTPVPHRGERNMPAYVRYVIEKLAEERGSDFESIERITTENAKRLFGIK